jgi:CubicO group peptidase (beta-lactamase class C family)
MTHTSGLLNWLPLYLQANDLSEVTSAIAKHGLQPTGPHSPVVYSDLGYILLGFALEKETGRPIDELAKSEIFDRLGLRRTMFNPPPELMREIAATEHGQTFEQKNAYIAQREVEALIGTNGKASRIGPESNGAFRQHLIWGEVHDGNAYFLRGVAGHAGLFSTARETCTLASQFLTDSILLEPESLELFTRNLTPGRGTDRSIGWVLASTHDCSAGPALPATAFGHTGFTGTSVWIDGSKRRVLVLLTNRVHPHIGNIEMKESRQGFHALAVEALETGR